MSRLLNGKLISCRVFPFFRAMSASFELNINFSGERLYVISAPHEQAKPSFTLACLGLAQLEKLTSWLSSCGALYVMIRLGYRDAKSRPVTGLSISIPFLGGKTYAPGYFPFSIFSYTLVLKTISRLTA